MKAKPVKTAIIQQTNGEHKDRKKIILSPSLFCFQHSNEVKKYDSTWKISTEINQPFQTKLLKVALHY